MKSFGTYLFTSAVTAEQARIGAAEKYARAYENRLTGPLDDATRAFIQARTSFYIATNSSSGFPYIQHRGGPQGFLKIIGDNTLGFADYRGNQQLISKGNLTEDDRVSLFFMDYSERRRLKAIGHMTLVDAAEKPDLIGPLTTDGQGPVERIATIKLAAIDWNCPQYIEQRFTQDQVTARVAPHLSARDRKIEALSARLRELGESPEAITAHRTET